MRERAAGVAEWVCPELNPGAAPEPRRRIYSLTFALAAAAAIAFLIVTNSVPANLPGRVETNRAEAWGW